MAAAHWFLYESDCTPDEQRLLMPGKAAMEDGVESAGSGNQIPGKLNVHQR